MGDELWCGQAQNGKNLDFKNLTWKVKVNYSPKTIKILTKVFCTFDPNSVILASRGDELWCIRAWGLTRTHTRTHRQTQATIVTEGQNQPRLKMPSPIISIPSMKVRPPHDSLIFITGILISRKTIAILKQHCVNWLSQVVFKLGTISSQPQCVNYFSQVSPIYEYWQIFSKHHEFPLKCT